MVDFANMYLGGGVMGKGMVQEEILFACHPELLMSQYVCESLRDWESV
jgi:poly(ADP-ribose) glycohydrolase